MALRVCDSAREEAASAAAQQRPVCSHKTSPDDLESQLGDAFAPGACAYFWSLSPQSREVEVWGLGLRMASISSDL